MEKIEDLNKKSYDSQLKIYKALRQILITKSLNDITVTDICEECNCSRSTFYRNFDNVIDILEIFFDYFYDRYLRKRVNEENQLLFFLKYWTRHRDLVYLLKTQAPMVLYTVVSKYTDPSWTDFHKKLKLDLFEIIIPSWSITKTQTPEEMERYLKEIFTEKAIDILLN